MTPKLLILSIRMEIFPFFFHILDWHYLIIQLKDHCATFTVLLLFQYLSTYSVLCASHDCNILMYSSHIRSTTVNMQPRTLNGAVWKHNTCTTKCPEWLINLITQFFSDLKVILCFMNCYGPELFFLIGKPSIWGNLLDFTEISKDIYRSIWSLLC